MGREGDKKAFVGHDHGQEVEGTDGKAPMSEKQWRDMPKGSRPKTKPSEEHQEPEKETQVATGNRRPPASSDTLLYVGRRIDSFRGPSSGEHKPGNFPKDKSGLPEDNPEHSVDQSKGQKGPVASKSGANVSYDEVVVGQLGGGEKKVQDSGSA